MQFVALLLDKVTFDSIVDIAIGIKQYIAFIAAHAKEQ